MGANLGHKLSEKVSVDEPSMAACEYYSRFLGSLLNECQRVRLIYWLSVATWRSKRSEWIEI